MFNSKFGLKFYRLDSLRMAWTCQWYQSHLSIAICLPKCSSASDIYIEAFLYKLRLYCIAHLIFPLTNGYELWIISTQTSNSFFTPKKSFSSYVRFLLHFVGDNVRSSYGRHLEDHLRYTEREIASPIEACVLFIKEYALKEEVGASSWLITCNSGWDLCQRLTIHLHLYTLPNIKTLDMKAGTDPVKIKYTHSIYYVYIMNSIRWYCSCNCCNNEWKLYWTKY